MVFKKFIVVDIDNTLTISGERGIFYRSRPRNYTALEAGVAHDEPITEVIEVIKLIAESGFHVVVLSGRSESTRENTSAWLKKHGMPFQRLLLKPDGDYGSTPAFKTAEIIKLVKEYGSDPLVIFEDEEANIDKFKEKGWVIFRPIHGRDVVTAG